MGILESIVISSSTSDILLYLKCKFNVKNRILKKTLVQTNLNFQSKNLFSVPPLCVSQSLLCVFLSPWKVTGTLGHQDIGTLGHRDTWTLGHWVGCGCGCPPTATVLLIFDIIEGFKNSKLPSYLLQRCKRLKPKPCLCRVEERGAWYLVKNFWFEWEA